MATNSPKKRTAIEAAADRAKTLTQTGLLQETKEMIAAGQLSLFEFAPWSDEMRAIPNDLARAALFTVRNKKIPREIRQNFPIFTTDKNVEITYTGLELRAEDDELVWQQVLEYAKRDVLGAPVSFSFYQLCTDLGWSINGRYYDKAEDCLTRLQATALKFTSNRIGGVVDSLSLISRFRVLDKGKRTSLCQIQIDPDIVVLFAGQYYTRFVWEKYRALSPTARRMYDYFASHKDPRPLPVETFRLMCGSDSTRPKKWREQSGSAGDELSGSGLINKTWITNGLIHCDRGDRALRYRPGPPPGDHGDREE